MKRLSAYLTMSAFFIVACGDEDKPTQATQPSPAGKASDQHDTLPIVSVESTSNGSYVFENEGYTVVFKRTGDAQNELTVYYWQIEIDGTDDRVEILRTVTFDPNKTTQSRIYGEFNDMDEDHKTTTVEIVASTEFSLEPEEYVPDPKNNRVSVQTRDDDGTLIELSLDPLDRVVGEGGAAQFYLVATAVDDGTFTSVGDLARVFESTSGSFSWSAEAVPSEAQSPADYPALSEILSFAYADFEIQPPADHRPASKIVSLADGDSKIEGGRLVLRQVLPSIPTVWDDEEEDDERFLVKLASAPGMDSRIGFGTRENIDGLPELSGNTFLKGVVTIGPLVDGTLRLVNGASGREGLLEIFYNGEWGTICDDYWTDDEAEVACRQLGFEGLEANFLRAGMGQGTGPIWMDNVMCNDADTRLADCVFGQQFDQTWGDHNCRHNEDVGLRCK